MPLREIATCPRPADQYAALRAGGVHRRDDAWVIARPEDVDAALTSRALTVAPPDATAALIGAVLLSDDREPYSAVGQQIERALRHHAPVQCTRRYAITEVVLGGVTVPKGARVWVMLAAAERGPTAPPGPVTGQPVDYEPRPNLRLPARIWITRS